MSLPLTRSPADRLSLIIRYLSASILGRERLLGYELVMAICERLSRIGSRFAALVLQAQEGTLRPPRPRTERAAARSSSPPAVPEIPTRPKLPRGFAWLLPLVPDAANYGCQLTHLLADPEIAALLSMSPGFGRALRPMCRMLGVSPLPEALQPPPPPTRALRIRPVVARSEPPMRPIYPKSRVVDGVEVYARRSRGGFSSA